MGPATTLRRANSAEGGGIREKKPGPVVKPGHRGWAMELVAGGTGGILLAVRRGAK